MRRSCARFFPLVTLGRSSLIAHLDGLRPGLPIRLSLDAALKVLRLFRRLGLSPLLGQRRLADLGLFLGVLGDGLAVGGDGGAL